MNGCVGLWVLYYGPYNNCKKSDRLYCSVVQKVQTAALVTTKTMLRSSFFALAVALSAAQTPINVVVCTEAL